MEIEQIVFWVLSIGAILSALIMVTRKGAVVSALSLVATFMCLGGLYLTLHAQFLAVVQVAVYAGAIMVLVLFVIMLLNLRNENISITSNKKTLIGVLASAGILAQILAAIFMSEEHLPTSLHSNAPVLGTTESIGAMLYTNYSFPFELASVILIAAAVGAIILAKKRIN